MPYEELVSKARRSRVSVGKVAAHLAVLKGMDDSLCGEDPFRAPRVVDDMIVLETLALAAGEDESAGPSSRGFLDAPPLLNIPSKVICRFSVGLLDVLDVPLLLGTAGDVDSAVAPLDWPEDIGWDLDLLLGESSAANASSTVLGSGIPPPPAMMSRLPALSCCYGPGVPEVDLAS